MQLNRHTLRDKKHYSKHNTFKYFNQMADYIPKIVMMMCYKRKKSIIQIIILLAKFLVNKN